MSSAEYRRRHGSAFAEPSVAAAYAHRPPYPAPAFEIVAGLLGTGRVLDVGCGTGGVARPLAALGFTVDAVDISAAMVEHGRQLPHGRDPRLRWHIGALDRVELSPPYDLVTAGESLHWLDRDAVLPLFARLLRPGGLLVILELAHAPVAWQAGLVEAIRTFSTNPEYRPVDLPAELTDRGLWAEVGRATTAPWTFRQTVGEYVESFHGRSAFARERMGPERARAFDDAVTALVTPGPVELPIVATLTWGRPLS